MKFYAQSDAESDNWRFQQDHHRGAFQAVPHEPIYHEGAFQSGIRKLNSRPHKGTPYGKGGGIIKGYRPKHGGNSQWGGLREPEQIHCPIQKGLRTAAYRIPQAYQKIKKWAIFRFILVSYSIVIASYLVIGIAIFLFVFSRMIITGEYM